MARSLRHDLQQRWTDEHLKHAIAVIEGKEVGGPFGVTADGLLDLRGVVVASPLRPENVCLDGVDFSYAEASRLIFAESSVHGCRFESAKICWGDFRSSFEGLSFHSANLRGSSFGGRISEYSHCDFTRANLSGSNGSRATFRDCVFNETKFKNAVLGNCAYVGCTFVGPIEKVIFSGGAGGGMDSCDLENASFVDCGFNYMNFSNCKTSNEMLHFRNWSNALARFLDLIDVQESPDIAAAGRRWGDVWNQRLDFTRENIVDLADLNKHLGPTIAGAMFDLFQQVALDVQQ